MYIYCNKGHPPTPYETRKQTVSVLGEGKEKGEYMFSSGGGGEGEGGNCIKPLCRSG